MEYLPTRDCERKVEQYADLADEARAQGKGDLADRFLLLAWAAYDGVDGELEEPDPNAAQVVVLRRP